MSEAAREEVRTDECKKTLVIETEENVSRTIPAVVERLARSCGAEGCFDHVSPVPIPSREAVVDIILTARRVLFPGYFTRETIDPINIGYFLGQEVTRLYQKLAGQITWAIRHDCFRYEQVECTHCNEQGKEKALAFLETLPDLRLALGDDVKAAFEGDPASKSYDQIIFSYPGLFAVTVYRLAHELDKLEVPLLPRIMTEYAHSTTGIDIHPGATIGRHFFIDHGTGVVIGETCAIGDQVRLYQGVTLGALSVPRGAGQSLRGKKRHPTIEDDVIIYSGATILGGETVIGARSIIGGNVWLTESVPPDSKVLLKKPELVIK
ncbi:MAG: serine O-acetyltransferase EpsC [Thermodesulfobacteriota bacterium]